MGTRRRQLKAMLRKNWLLKIRHPFITSAEILLPTVVMLLLIVVRTRVDTQLHPVQAYIREEMFVEVGKSVISPDFDSVLRSLSSKGEHLAFAPDTDETRSMIGILSLKFPLLKVVGRIYQDELELETYLRSESYGIIDQAMNLSNPKIKGAIIFHAQGPQFFDYSIRLNHSWAFSGFPDIKTIMDVNGPYLNDLELGVSNVPTLQYGFSGFLTVYLLGFLYPISRLISYSVSEKEQKIKEGLYMMGLKDEIFYLSWFITYCVQFAVSSAIITVCTMSSLFIYSDKSVVFMYFFVFGLSAVMLSFLISTFFSRAKTAVAVGTLSFLGAFFPYYTVNDPSVPMILKVLASLLSPTAFALGTVNFADYERAHVGVRWTNIWQDSSGVNFLACLGMMMLDTVLYCILGLYLDKVMPKENGVSYPWYFLFVKSFWRKKSSPSHGSHLEVKFNGITSKTPNGCIGSNVPTVEAVNLDMKQQEVDSRCIQIRNLHKVYTTKRGKCCAVNSLQLTLYENQILALLGHNGAGKSTTISMLVGLLPPTSGDAMVFGKNIRTDMDEIRKGLGVCAQNDILFPELTVREHLEIFAILKGVEEDLLERKVNEMVDEVGLADKVNTIVNSLSGGMKRKLSLGIALIGDSKVIILDEPTSGMDPYSMRSTWQLIKKIKKGRIILLTTHSMDEADVLGDRIAIMANGSLRCCGSSLFLKHRYGVGYTLTLVKTTPRNTIAADIVHRHIPSATCLSDSGTEICFRLPLASSSSFENMFREIESCIKEKSTSVEMNSTIDEQRHGIESYGISVTTLEEVFLRVAGHGLEEDEEEGYSKAPLETAHDVPTVKMLTTKPFFLGYLEFFSVICSTVWSTCTSILTWALSLIPLLVVNFFCCGIVTRTTFWRHSKALIRKRAVSARRDRRTIVFQLLIPGVFLFLGLLLLKLRPHPDQNSVTLTTSHFNPLLVGGGGGGPIPFNLSIPIARKVASYVKGGWIQELQPRTYKFPNSEKVLAEAVKAAGPSLGPTLVTMSEFLITSLNESYQSRYGAVVMDDQYDDGSVGFTVLHNCSCQHAAPTYISLMNSAILRLATRDANMTIQTHNHPLPMTSSQRSQRHDLDAFSAAIIVNIAFAFIPASFVVAIVKEREVKAKHQQLISGVSILSYWISTFVWDFISFLIPTSVAIVLFLFFGMFFFLCVVI
ncbi:ABC transporter A family member 1 [Acorus gramineus]|uniref:ABC transporter A family member 1 n=1 Tax=Acorus gramineus TaxID=55184 RepID=A0AAV9BK45_ACOGR|nr:ABC transporter A family member 1 [Acorus gramineus]